MATPPSRLAIVDLETTGMSPTGDRVTEVAVMLVDDDVVVEEWTRLVNPEMSIPPAIQALTGISNALVADAPRFAQIAAELWTKLEGRVFVAHNARFDYGFLKNEFRRLGSRFQAPVLCTVRLSRALYPRFRGHGLDALAARHGLHVADRHRALGDVRLVWQFLTCALAEHGAQELQSAIGRLLKTPSLPPHLPRETLDSLPEGPGVYLFYGLNALPIYVGKSVNLRERVLSHFSADHRSGKDLKLSAAIHRISFEETCGELGALLREATLVKELQPLYNRQLRKREELVALSLDAQTGALHWLAAAEADPGVPGSWFGPFPSRSRARSVLAALAGEHGLCWKALGLEKRAGPCFARQLKKCRGACCGEEDAVHHGLRVAAALLPYRIKAWPFSATVGVRETHPETGRERIEVFDQWRHLGGADTDAELADLLAAPRRTRFDFDVYRILARHFALPGRMRQAIVLPGASLRA
ncbi:MAG: hypothetical protein F9K47_00140 [Burkholderiales bacterium]|nr:MAG: hypothetical protein F9K47_00140 [Burkholderiales bacterium]